MKILLITPYHPKLQPAKPLPEYQVQSFWLKAIEKLGHQAKTLPLAKKQSKLFNQIKLKKITNQFNPDHIFFSAGLDKLFSIKSTLFFSGVPPSILSTNELKAGKSAKKIVVNDPNHKKDWEKLTSAKVINLPFSAVDPNVFKPSKSRKTIDFSFVGTLFSNRQVQLEKIIKAKVNLKIWGWIPPKTKLLPSLKSSYQGEAWGKQVVKIYQQSKISLNLVPDHMVDGGNLRTFEIPACKTLQFIDKINPNYYTHKKEIILFNNPQDLKEKLDFYLSNPTKLKKIANDGYTKTIKNHTFNHRFAKLLKLL